MKTAVFRAGKPEESEVYTIPPQALESTTTFPRKRSIYPAATTDARFSAFPPFPVSPRRLCMPVPALAGGWGRGA